MSPLADETFRRMFAAQVVSLAGTGLSSIALALLAYDMAGGDAGFILGTVFAIKMVAYIGIAPIVGAFSAQLSRQKFLVVLDLIRAGVVISIPFVSEVWQIYVLIFVLNACSAGFTPTYQATIVDLLPDEAQYTRALSLSRLAYDLENLLSPLLAAAALLVLSYNALFVANAITFIISAFLVLSVRLPSLQSQQRRDENGWTNVMFGIRAYLATPRLRGLLALSLALAVSGAMVIVNTVVYVRDYLGGTQSETAWAFAAYGAGSMTIALMLPRLLDRFADRPFMLTGGGVLVVGLLFGALQPNLVLLLVLWAILGMGSSLIQTPAGRLLRKSAGEADRPALYAAHFALSHCCWLIAYPVAGWIGGTFSLSVAFVVLATIALAATIVALLFTPAADKLDLSHEHSAQYHQHQHVHDEHHQHSHAGWEGPEPHRHEHQHIPLQHTHPFVIDRHHSVWP